MNRAVSGLVVAMLAIPALSSTATAASSTIRTGTVKVESTITLSANVPAMATLSATGAASLYDPAAGTYEASVTATVKRSGKKATVVLMLPYRWTVVGKSDVVTVSLSIRANSAGSPSTEVSALIPLPANGATAQVVLPASL
jgi:hypothetical protein